MNDQKAIDSYYDDMENPPYDDLPQIDDREALRQEVHEAMTRVVELEGERERLENLFFEWWFSDDIPEDESNVVYFNEVMKMSPKLSERINAELRVLLKPPTGGEGGEA